MESSLTFKTNDVAKQTNPFIISLKKKLKELKMSTKDFAKEIATPYERVHKWLLGKSNPKTNDSKKIEEWLTKMEKVTSVSGKKKALTGIELIQVIVTDNSKVVDQNGQIIIQNGRIVDMNAKITEMNFKLTEYLKPPPGNPGQPSA